MDSNLECGVKLLKNLIDAQNVKNYKPGIGNIMAGYNAGEGAMSYSKSIGFESYSKWEVPDNDQYYAKSNVGNTRLRYVPKGLETHKKLYAKAQSLATK